MKKIVSLMLVLLLAIGIVTATYTPERNYKVLACDDTDSDPTSNALNVLVKGKLIMVPINNPGTRVEITDRCKDDTHIYEGRCQFGSSGVYGQFFEVDCSQWRKVCDDGACVDK